MAFTSVRVTRAGIDCGVGIGRGRHERRSPEHDDVLDRWWIGGYYRHLWVPGYITDPFFASAPAISNNGFGLVATYRTLGSLNIEMGVGYMPYSFHGPFLADGKPIEDTELVRSDLKFWHLTGSLMWDIEFHRTVALEIGVGLDLGLFSGDVIRNSAYLDGKTGRFKDCSGPLMPATLGPNGIPYCDVPKNGGKSDKPGDNGELYNQREGRWPTVMAFPMLPHVALRLQPFKHLTIKGEFAFGIAQMFAGVSLHVSLGLLKAGPKEVFEKQPEPPPANGRVIGKVVDASSGAPIGGATVRVLGRALSPLSTEPDGRFIVDRLDPGMVMFESSTPTMRRASAARRSRSAAATWRSIASSRPRHASARSAASSPTRTARRSRIRSSSCSGRATRRSRATIAGCSLRSIYRRARIASASRPTTTWCRWSRSRWSRRTRRCRRSS